MGAPTGHDNYSGDLPAGEVIWDRTADRLVTADVTVPAGCHLIVEPGTWIVGQENVNFFVYGKVTVRGTADEPVVITSENPSEPWGGMEFHTADASFQRSGSAVDENFLDRIGRVRAISADDRSVVEATPPVLPPGFALEQNFPNPFNSSTLIRFTLPAAEVVELAVYNIVGQQVAILVHGLRQPGIHTVHWNAWSEPGEQLTSGLEPKFCNKLPHL